MVGFLRRLSDRRTCRIGLFGLTSGSGLTHISIAAANYYASKERKSVLYLEGGPTNGRKTCPEGSVISLRTKHTFSCAGISGFERDGVRYVPLCAPSDIRRLLSERYDVIIAEVPVGCDGREALTLGMFDRSFWLFSAKPWKYSAFEMRMQQLVNHDAGIEQGEHWSFGLTKHEQKTILAQFHLKCREIPVICDPFHLKKQDIRFLKEFLRI